MLPENFIGMPGSPPELQWEWTKKMKEVTAVGVTRCHFLSLLLVPHLTLLVWRKVKSVESRSLQALEIRCRLAVTRTQPLGSQLHQVQANYFLFIWEVRMTSLVKCRIKWAGIELSFNALALSNHPLNSFPCKVWAWDKEEKVKHVVISQVHIKGD